MSDPPRSAVLCRSRWPDRVDRSIETSGHDSLLPALRAAGQPIASSCTGSSVCGRCVVEVLEGSDALREPEADEQEVLAREGVASPRFRLACRTLPILPGVVLTTTYW